MSGSRDEITGPLSRGPLSFIGPVRVRMALDVTVGSDFMDVFADSHHLVRVPSSLSGPVGRDEQLAGEILIRLLLAKARGPR